MKSASLDGGEEAVEEMAKQQADRIKRDEDAAAARLVQERLDSEKT